MNNQIADSSFRDPSGFIFTREGIIYRQINQIYSDSYERLMGSGLYKDLVHAGFLIPHTEADIDPAFPGTAYKVIRPEQIPFISYPYEWSFGQLKDAALATLSIQKHALTFNFSLKDASAYNIQFPHGKATLIDTLSFEPYIDGEPWVAYRQFCQHFMAPLALMAYCDVRLNQLSRVFIDGIPLDLASSLLPKHTRWKLGLNLHIHIHARVQKQYADTAISEMRGKRKMSKQALLGFITSLESTIKKLHWQPAGTEWVEYYDHTNYNDAAFDHKKQLVCEWTNIIAPKIIWDLGANNGTFSRVAAQSSAYVISSDIDPAAVELNYQTCKKDREENILPLIIDLTNPSPSIGWNNKERNSFLERGPADLVLALAVIHHLAISNNVPLYSLAGFFASTGKALIIEFIPKTDTQIQKLLRNRQDIFTEYNRQEFERILNERFMILNSVQLSNSERWLYLMKTKEK
jgi:hypothetical protein